MAKSVTFGFGRMNPPTNGHERLVKEIKRVARMNGSEAHLYVSRTQDKIMGPGNKNPLSYNEKKKYVRLAFPDVFRDNPTCINAFKTVEFLIAQGYRSIAYVHGSDAEQVDAAKKIIQYTHRDHPEIMITSVELKRTNGGGAEGMSATKMRQFVVDGKVDKFLENVAGNLKFNDAAALELYDILKTRLKKL